jgi:protein SCO1/2/putative membrane protein
VNRSYQLGLTILTGTVLAAAALVGIVGVRAPQVSAAQDLGRSPFALGSFRLEERSGRTVTDADLAGDVWVAAFVFTRCPSSCPRITSTMKGMQANLAGSYVRLVSISVDPQHDTPAVLSDYANRFGADPARWWFLTGPRDDIYNLILDRFKVPVSESSPADRKAGAEAVSHSARLALVDRGNRVIGYFDADDPAAVKQILARARQLDRAWVGALPTLNAALNGSAAVLLLTGWFLIRAGRARAHATCMITSLVVSALFLASYLIYHYDVGSVPFRGAGPIRSVYFTVLLSHTVLAVAVVPLVAITVYHAWRKQYQKHVRIARVTFPIWLYVSITGVVVYLMLYHLDVSAAYPS